MSRWLLLTLLLLAALALAFRCPSLSVRPLHNDEGVNAYKFAQLWPHGSYKYDPNEHHGPTLIYATYALAALTGAPPIDRFSDGRLRVLTVLFGVGLILLLPLTLDGLGRRGTAWGALFLAVSPAMVFYSCYYIHEMLLVFFVYLALAAGWRYWRTRKLGWMLTAGAALGLAHATKETFVLNLVAAAGAAFLSFLWNRRIDASGLPDKATKLDWRHAAAGLAVWAAVAVLLFTSFLTNASGPLDSIRTYLPWLNRAGGDSPHIHPWSYYFHHLLWFHPAKGPVWTELLIFLLAAVGAAAGFVRQSLGRAHGGFVRFLAFYTVALAIIYSAISYKTPWCLLSFWHGAILLAGVGAAVLLRWLRPRLVRAAVAVLLVAGSVHLGWEAWQLSVPLSTDRRNPYIYSQTMPDLLNLVSKVEALAQSSPQRSETLIKVMSPGGDFWPLPWYLRAYKNTGWWEELPSDPYAPIMVVSARFHAGLDENKTHLMIGYYQMRPDVFFELYVQKELWEAYLRDHPPKPEE